MMNQEGPSILVVDDDVDNCRNLADILADLGYRVDTAPDGQTALQLVRRQRYDLALLDLMMPGMDGAALYEEMKKIRAGTVAVVVTAYPNSPRAEAALAAGTWKVFPKPVDFPGLLALVEEAMGQPLLLVVDDDRDLCLNLWDLLRERGYRVCLAHDVRTATQRLQGDAYQAIVLDWKLPDGDGTVVLQAARETNPQAQVVVVTGYRDELQERLQQVLAEGARAVLPKPLDVPELLTTLGSLEGVSNASKPSRPEALR
jgi:two-component system response regulator HydG